MDSLKIVDAHQHFWDLAQNYYPWLCDEPSIPFRYGHYSAIRKTYLPNDYFRDTAGHQVVKTVHIVCDFPRSEQEKLFHDNAIRVYRLMTR